MKVCSRLAALLVVPAFASVSGACSVGDQLCPVGTNYNDKDDACPYGPPGGPKRAPVSCPPAAARTGADCDGVSFSETVFPILDDPARGSCTANGCHGDVQNKVLLPPGDATAVYRALAAYRIPGLQAAYINAGDPSTSWITCNLREPTIGTKMPLGGTMKDEDVAAVELWLGCGGTP